MKSLSEFSIKTCKYSDNMLWPQWVTIHLTSSKIYQVSPDKTHLFLGASAKSNSTNNEQKLLDQIFSRYNKKVRPVFDDSIPVQVQFGARLRKVMKVVSTCCGLYGRFCPGQSSLHDWTGFTRVSGEMFVLSFTYMNRSFLPKDKTRYVPNLA